MFLSMRMVWKPFVIGLLLCAPVAAIAQQDTGKAQGSDDKKPAAANDLLAQEQSRLADKYRRLENLIFKMADFESTSNPRRAALLKQAYKQSKDRLTQAQLNGIVQFLSQKKFKLAIDGQQITEKDLKDLLELLLKENRSDRLKTEAQKYREYIKELKRLERLQRSVRGRTEGGGEAKKLAKNQQQIADRTGGLAKKLEQDAEQSAAQKEGGEKDQSDSPDKPAGEKKTKDGKDKQKQNGKGAQKGKGKHKEGQKGKEGDSKEKKPGDSKQKNDKKQSGKSPQDKKGDKDKKGDQKSPQGKSGDKKQSKSGDKKGKPSSQGKSQQQGQQQQQGKSGDQDSQQKQQQKQDETPARKRVREAEQKMREAQQRLEEAKRGESVKKQTEAIEKLQEAIAELEEVLRQLREEEIERVLALLEGRFRKMLELQLKVYESTIRLGKIPKDKRNRAVDIRANELSGDERRIVAQADRCLTLLLEEGSSIAFPEVVDQMRDDMEEVSARLAQTKVERITQDLEEEIIATLEEMIEALQKAQQDQEESRNRPSRPSQPGDPPLVDILSELKMIRSLQFRVNKRTQRYARLLENVDDPVGQATDQDLRQAIGKLGEREARIQRITRDIVLGKNK